MYKADFVLNKKHLLIDSFMFVIGVGIFGDAGQRNILSRRHIVHMKFDLLMLGKEIFLSR